MTYVEMTSPEPLRPGGAPPTELELVPHEVAGDLALRDTFERVGAPYGWSTAARTEEGWREWLTTPHNSRWLIREAATGAAAGVVELAPRSGGEVEILAFGLVPEFVGRGYGGAALTLTIAKAWKTPSRDSEPQRVLLRTSSRDSPRALPNYLARGFTVYRTEQKQKELNPDTRLPPPVAGTAARPPYPTPRSGPGTA